jgi:hypothetical protein
VWVQGVTRRFGARSALEGVSITVALAARWLNSHSRCLDDAGFLEPAGGRTACCMCRSSAQHKNILSLAGGHMAASQARPRR